MDLHVPVWAVPVLLTVAIWTGCILWPVSKGGGDYNFAPAFDAAVHLIVGIILTLLVWVFFFAALALA